jgi:2-C-methyl-D-erythritol 4-phosphate cytidylyltransferase
MTGAPAGVVAIVAAAGSGQRLGLKVRKPFVKLAGIPLIVHTLKALSGSCAIDAIIVAAQPGFVGRFEALIKKYRLAKVAAVVAGGATRAESVRNCLARVDDSFDIVLIHDGGRPFIDAGTIALSVAMARKYGGAIVAVPENDTVKLAGDDLFVKKTLPRSRIFRAQTPQVFKRELIKKAYAAGITAGVTDDAGLVERVGGKVKIVTGSYRNIKITTKEDLKLAEVFI